MAGISKDALKRHRISNFQSIIEVDYAAANGFGRFWFARLRIVSL
jgi:hypothetical protein